MQTVGYISDVQESVVALRYDTAGYSNNAG